MNHSYDHTEETTVEVEKTDELVSHKVKEPFYVIQNIMLLSSKEIIEESN